MQKQHIGFIGLGLMGVPIVYRLLAAGYPVTVWNRSHEKTAVFAGSGASIATDIAALVAESDILMLCVTDTQAVESVVFADNGIVHFARAGQILIDLSSIDPDATRNMAGKLKDACDVEWVDAPVSGGVVGAEQGTLAIMVGGEESVIDLLRPVLEPISQRVTRMGPVGAGQVTKICNQMLVSCNVLVMAEMMALAEKSGVDAGQIPVALKGGFADSIPLQLTGTRMAERDFDVVKWHVKTLLKDLDMAGHLARTMNSAIPMAGLGAELMRLHANQGNTEKDPCTLVTMYTEKNR